MKKNWGYQVYDHTFETYPVRWYEHIRLRWLMAVMLIPVLAYGQTRASIPSALWLSILGLIGYFVALISDTYTTLLVMCLKPQFDRQGIEFPIQEQNRLLPPHPTFRHLVLGWPTLISLAGIPLVFIAPMSGILVLL